MNLDWRIAMALNHIAVFEVAVEKGSFTKAADRLGTTQPSVSRHIASLEKLLGVALFTRLHHRVELTSDGQAFYDAVKLGLGHIRQVADQIAVAPNRKTLSIGCTYGFAHLWLMPRFSALQKLVPERELRMITSDTRTLFDLKEVDFALRFGVGEWTDGDSCKLFDEQLFPVCSPEFAQKNFGSRTTVAADTLVQMPLIHEHEDEYSWLSWQQFLARHGVEYKPQQDTYFYDSYALTLQAAVEGQGIALAWPHFTEAHLQSGQLVELQGLRVTTDHGYFLAYRWQHPYAQRVSDWFRSMANDHTRGGQ